MQGGENADIHFVETIFRVWPRPVNRFGVLSKIFRWSEFDILHSKRTAYSSSDLCYFSSVTLNILNTHKL